MSDRRITGTENEFGLLIQRKEGEEFEIPELDLVVKAIKRYCPLQKEVNSFRENGSRFRHDINSHPEYSTPEGDTVWGTVTHEIAGERVAYQTFEEARRKGRFHNFNLNKRVVDYERNTWGYHQNFSTDRSKISLDAKGLSLLGIHLVTLNLFTGAGSIVRSAKDKPMYTIAQKALDLNCDFSTSTQPNKPVVNIKDEPLADREKWGRIHVTSVDANMSPWAIAMRLGTISIILQLIEGGFNSEHLEPEQNLHTLGLLVAEDLDMKKTVRLKNGKSILPIELQTELLEAVRRRSEAIGFDKEKMWVIAEWERALNDLASNIESLEDRVDWVTKRLIIEKMRTKHNLSLGSDKIKGVDISWGNLSPKGIGMLMRQTLWSKWMPDEELIAESMVSPPPTTRANARGVFIGKFADKGTTTDADWVTLKAKGTTVSLKDPFQPRNEKLDKLLEAA